jgi:SpoVK/Ycf46/Vps4 family AAA+-type ATPase
MKEYTMTTTETLSCAIAGIEEFQLLSPGTLTVLNRAAWQAQSLEATEVAPEHLLLASIMADDEAIAEALDQLGMDMQVLRSQVHSIFQQQDVPKIEDVGPIPLSPDARDCMRWAALQAALHYQQAILPVHVLLSSLRSPCVQPLLALLFSEREAALPVYIAEETPVGYTRALDQLIRARVRMQRIIPSVSHGHCRMLMSIECPTLIFADILGFHVVKQELRPVVDFLRKPRLHQSEHVVSACGLLLVGPPGNSRAMLIRALAGEAVVSLVCLSIPALVEMLLTSEEYVEQSELDADLDNEVYRRFRQERMKERGREILQTVFEQARMAAPCIVLLDALDALARIEVELRTYLQKQIMMAMDARDYHPAIVVVAATHRPEYLDSMLLQPGRFHHKVVLDGTMTRSFVQGRMLCPGCQHEVPPRWNYCAYCGEALARLCAGCGNRLPDVWGLRFCPVCGATAGSH